MLADIHGREPIARLEFVGLPLAVLHNGTHVVVCPFDYVTNTLEVREGVASYLQAHPDVSSVLVVAGGVSAQARGMFESARLRLVEGGVSNW